MDSTLFFETHGLFHYSCNIGPENRTPTRTLFSCNIWTLTLFLQHMDSHIYSCNTWTLLYSISLKPWALTLFRATHGLSSLAIRNPWTLHFFLPHMDSHTFSCNKLTLTPSRATQGLSKKTTLSRVLTYLLIYGLLTALLVTQKNSRAPLPIDNFTTSRTLLKDGLSHYKTAYNAICTLPIHRLIKTDFYRTLNYITSQCYWYYMDTKG